jgi:hypothetical protein
MRFVIGVLTLMVASTFAYAGPQTTNFTPRNNIVQIACNQQSASVCQQQANGCGNFCRGTDYQTCRQECLNRYKDCKVNAGCSD